MKRIFMFMLGGCLSINVSLAEEVQSLPTHATAAYPSSSAEPSLSQPASRNQTCPSTAVTNPAMAGTATFGKICLSPGAAIFRRGDE